MGKDEWQSRNGVRGSLMENHSPITEKEDAQAAEGLSPCQPIARQHLAYKRQARACLDKGHS